MNTYKLCPQRSTHARKLATRKAQPRLEALEDRTALDTGLNIVANGMEILGIAWGGPTMIMGMAPGGQAAGAGRSPMLQGATNGTIGPQASDATVVQGVNTAGTVRVNNLANLEALLNQSSSVDARIDKLPGRLELTDGDEPRPQTREHVLLARQVGVAAVDAAFSTYEAGALATPGAINWLVASARDANLFS